jgi:hypothetical protein
MESNSLIAIIDFIRLFNRNNCDYRQYIYTTIIINKQAKLSDTK